ncbi:hypothetical protein N9Z92_00380 [Akkermansiaceae bacterium]|nr:hypothetical protein [Akkermansiaceae bacterium]MDB4572342.1 hypothetical protein [Akkermansiaceae bacterium]
MSSESAPYQPPEHDSEFGGVRDFVPKSDCVPKSDWHIRIVYLLPTTLYLAGALALQGILTLSGLNVSGVSLPVTSVIFGSLALPASVYTGNYYRLRDQNNFGTMIVMVCIHLVQHTFILFGAAIVLLMFS